MPLVPYLEGDMKGHIAGVARVHIAGDDDPGLGGQHVQVTEGLQVVPDKKYGECNKRSY